MSRELSANRGKVTLAQIASQHIAEILDSDVFLWLPDDKRIWLNSKMLNPHEKQELSFTAPEKSGTYPYVCTFPGHAVLMWGVLSVTK